MKRMFVSVWLLLACALAWALPTVQQVEAAVQQGRYAQAENMMREVVDAKPGSAKGHYLYAEILAHNGSFAKAAEEAAKARQLDPDIKFTQPEKFRTFENLLAREQQQRAQPTTSSKSAHPAAAVAPPPAQSAVAIPGWVWGGGLALVAYLLWRGFSRSRRSASAGMAPTYPSAGMPPGYPGAAPPMNGYAGNAMGSTGAPYAGVPPAAPSNGLLRTGMAVAGGVAAGMLVDEMLHRRQGGGGTDQLAGLQHGVFDAPPIDDAAANELENRSVDFGNGADWDTGSAATDFGGGGSDDAGWD